MGWFDRFRAMRARARFMPTPRAIRRRTTAIVGTAVILATTAVLVMLERRGAERESRIVEWARENAVEPVSLIARAVRNRPVLLVGDVAGAAAPKRFAALLIDSLGSAGALDAVGLEVPSDQQTWIDLYIETDPEDTSVLLAHPRTVRSGTEAGVPLLEVYRTVWRVNHALGVNRRIRILALDTPAWPPAPGLSPARALAVFAERDEHMFDVLEARMLARNPRARVLVLADGLRVRRGGARVSTGGIAPIQLDWLGKRLVEFGAPVFSVLVDAQRGAGATSPLAGHSASPLHTLLRNRLGLPSHGIALPIRADSEITADWLGQAARPGVEIEPLTANTELARLIDAWVFLPN